MQQTLLRQATISEEEQVDPFLFFFPHIIFYTLQLSGIHSPINIITVYWSFFQRALEMKFEDKAIRRGFMRKVYSILSVQVE